MRNCNAHQIPNRHETARAFGRKLKDSLFARMVAVSPDDEERAWAVLVKFQDQDFSFVDCTIFAVIQRVKLSTAFTFDRHFRVMNFETAQG